MQNVMLQLQLYQLKIMQNCGSNWNLILKEQWAGINIYQEDQQKDEPHI